LKYLGLIVEYNPFHNGHKIHLNESLKKDDFDGVVAVMSGNFIQRGEIALVDKYTRAKTAVENGVNLVLELPVVNAVSSAQKFAFGSTYILDKIGIVSDIIFGSESSDINSIINISNHLIDIENNSKEELKYYLKKGISYSNAIKEIFDSKGLIITQKPNDMLGLQYVKALTELKSNIIPSCISRRSVDYNSDYSVDGIASATHIRNLSSQNQDFSKLVPESTRDILMDENFIYNQDFLMLLRFKILSLGKEELSKFRYVDEGIENLIFNNALIYDDYNDFIMSIKSKRYTMTRIKRALINILIGIKKIDVINFNLETPSYGRILAFDSKGANMIKNIKKKSDFPLINKNNKFYTEDLEILKKMELDLFSDHIYSLISSNNLLENFYKNPYYKK
jgi:predicted nucleotidyltransferase